MTDALSKPCTAFQGDGLLSTGPLIEVALAVKNAFEQGTTQAVLVFDDANGRVVDLDLRGSKANIIARLLQPQPPDDDRAAMRGKVAAPSSEASTVPRGRGRPRLGVVAREVTLLPRHWDWLAAQPGGASVTLRRLVDEARRGGGDAQLKRAAHEAAYRFMSALAGDLPGFEEALRALFADDRHRFEARVAAWPQDVRKYATRLAFGREDGNVRG